MWRRTSSPSSTAITNHRSPIADPQEHHVAVTRTGRYVTLGPETCASEVWFGFHGYGQLAGSLAKWLAPLDDGSRLIVVPEGLSRFYLAGTAGRVGASWMTAEDRLREIHDYVRYLDAVYADVRPRAAAQAPTHLLGFSQGSATACRWVAQGDVQPSRLIIWGGEVPPDLDWPQTAERFRSLEVLLVAGTDDEYATPAALARYERALESERIPHKTIPFDGGHRIDAAVLREIAGSP